MNRWVLSITCLLIVSFSAFAITMSSQSKNELPIQVASKLIEPNSVTLSLDVAEPGWNMVGSEQDPVMVAEFIDAGFIEEEGLPMVPVAGRMFRLPPHTGVSVEVISADYETLSGVDYAAYSSNGKPTEFTRALTNKDEWFPGKIADVSPPAIFRAFRVSKLNLFPVQVNTATNEVRVYSNIKVKINYEGTDDRAAMDEWPTKLSTTYIPWYEMFLDWDENELDEYELYRGSVQVIMQDEPPLHASLKPWVDWKRQKGWEIDFLTDTDVPNWSANSIISELQDRWDSMDEKFDYIVIIGDGQGNISVPAGPTRNLGDYAYTLMTDGDQFQDVAVGRISVNSTNELNNYVRKVFRYERTPYMDETHWYLHGAVMGVSHYSGISTYLVGHYWRTELFNIGFTQVDTAFSVNDEPARGQSIDHINAGVSFYNFRGGINDGLQVANINNLENTNMLFVCCDVTCVTGDWVNSTSQSEAYMRAGSANSPIGGICGMGMATATTNTGRNNTVSGGLAFTMIRQRLPFLGQGFFGSKVALYQNYGEYEFDRFREFSEMFNLIGDPTVMIWTAVPADLITDVPDTLNIGQNTMDVFVTDIQGEPVEDAWVTLYKVDEDDDFIYRTLTDQDGVAYLDSPFRHPGEVILTITKQNFIPEIDTLDIVNVEELVGYDEIVFQDDGNNGTVGNNNGIPEAGETVGLVVTARNFGDATQNNITATATCDDDWVLNVTGTASFGNINAGETGTSDDLILVELSPETQHEWINHIHLTFTSNENEYSDDFSFTVQAPQFAFVSINGLGDFDPGDNTTISITLKNIGGSNAGLMTGYLRSLDPFLSIGTNEAEVPSTNIGSTVTSGNFVIASHPETFPGHTSRARLVLVTETGQRDSLVFNVTIGQKSPTDPTGPDKYGYYAFDNLDTGYELAPEYEWIEINPNEAGNDFNGIDLNMSDTGNNDDMSVVVDLPFDVQYYGQVFDQITICVNGWAAMGNEGWFVNMRNYYIPSPLGPHNMIAPYWDERVTTGGGAVFYYYDEPNGRFIVEWYELPDQYNNAPCTFQMILFDQIEGHLTYTHDAEILFQYGDVEHTTGPTGGHGTVPYYTTGIENEAQDDGVLYSYWDTPEPGSNSVVEGRAILFSTNVTLITGTIQGYVHRYENEDPIPNMTVRTSDYVFSAETDENGYFVMNEVVVGVHDLVVEGIGFNNTYGDSIIVAEDSTTNVVFRGEGTDEVFPGMKHPEFVANRDSIIMRINPESSQVKVVELGNTGNGQLDYAFKVLFHEPAENLIEPVRDNNNNELDDPWDNYYEYELIEDEVKNRGVTFMNNEFWVSGSYNNDARETNKFYRYSKEGEYIATYEQPVDNHSSAGFYGITNDGQYLYGVDRGRIYQMMYDEGTYSVELVNSWNCALNAVRYLTYDPDRELLWMGEYDSDVTAYNLDGEIVAEFPQDIYPRGLGYFGDDESGYCLYFVCRQEDRDDYDIIKMHPETGEFLQVMHFESDGGFLPMGSDITNKLNPLVWTFMTVMDADPPTDRIKIWEVNINTRWIDISPMVNVIEPDQNQNIDVTVYTTDLPVSIYEAWLEISHNAIEQRYVLPMRIDVTEDILIADPDVSGLPLEWAFEGAYPNPFNPTVTLDFKLKQNALVQANVYNLLGQKVATIADYVFNAGSHSISFDGKDLASGMYFLDFKAGPIHHKQKLMLMK